MKQFKYTEILRAEIEHILECYSKIFNISEIERRCELPKRSIYKASLKEYNHKDVEDLNTYPLPGYQALTDTQIVKLAMFFYCNRIEIRNDHEWEETGQ